MDHLQYRHALAAQLEASELAFPVSEYDARLARVRGTMREAGLAPHIDRVFFSGVFGYAVGAQFPPSWVEGSGYIARGQPREFETDMVFHLPLCLRLPGQWGIGISDTVQVTAGGGVALTDNDWELTQV